jgi:hypothetical protein
MASYNEVHMVLQLSLAICALFQKVTSVDVVHGDVLNSTHLAMLFFDMRAKRLMQAPKLHGIFCHEVMEPLAD